MPDNLYIKERLSERRSRTPYRVLLILALVLAIVATIIAVVFKNPQPESETPQESVAVTNETVASVESETITSNTDEEPVADSRILALLREGEESAAAEDLVKARIKLLRVLDLTKSTVARNRACKLLDKINIDLLLTPHPMPGKKDYIIKKGDILQRIAREFNTNIELIQRSNNIKGALIHPGQRLRIPNGEFSIHIDKSDNILTLFYNGHYFKSYRIGTGKFNKTPVGTTKIIDRIAQPTWWRPDGKAIPYGTKENVLGTHWLALDIPGYGIHGTWEPDSIGKYESAGCIRMLNENIEELYTIVPIGTSVVIEE